jgi:thioredoxin 1
MPFVEDMAGQYNGRLKVVKVNAQENRRLCVQLNVRSLPTFLFFAQGQEVDRLTGQINTGELQRWIEEQLTQSTGE